MLIAVVICLILALLAFTLAAAGVATRFNLLAVGLFLLTLAWTIPAISSL